MLKIYNTLSKQKEVFKPLHANEVRLYCCGMTVYDYCHLGHARTTMIIFDVVTRYLRQRGYKVTYVRNITDIDDKIIKRAQDNNEEFSVLTERMIKAMHEDAAALGVLPPDHEPRATDHIPQIISMIEKLIKKDHAYAADDGDVFFAIDSFKDYGKLSHKTIDDLQAGTRVEVNQIKKNPFDFVLWKSAKPGEPSWDSPWGQGRPGWHIECSAMSSDLLGQPFDIHGGGFDLIFPHHENEIAQSEACLDKQFVNTWMHVGFLQIDKEKMSKSLNNFFTIRDVLAEYPAEVIRMFMLTSHYRSPLNYSNVALNNARQGLERLYLALRGLTLPKVKPHDNDPYVARFIEAMDDDFNTPEALAVLFDLARDINKLKETDIKQAEQLAGILSYLADNFGILEHNADEFLQTGTDKLDTTAIDQLIAAREQARNDKNWAEADKLRDQLLAMGIAIEDTAKGTIWRRD